ncbi:MAG: Rpn family recombination-promoting nuclease/putative transposase [Lachnospiraceae bacterium]|nr:Rpn family recombination-promoting nuclease/putative transposase [Lachnospiraceae bacterium]
MGEKDIAEKTLEAFNDVFADIVNGLLFEGREVLKEHSLIDAQPVAMYKSEGRIHEQERDIAKYWYKTSNERINVRIAFLGVENQTSYDRDMPLRVMGYDGASYRAELSQEDRYPVITLVLYFGSQHWGKNKCIYDAIDIPEELRPYVSDYKINLFEIAFLPEEAIHHFHSDFRIVVDYFIHSRTNPNYRPVDPEKFMHVDEVLKLMSVLTHDERFVDVLEYEGGRPENMCEVLDRVEARGRAQGLEEGRRMLDEVEARGRAQGLEEGRRMLDEVEARGRAQGLEEGRRMLDEVEARGRAQGLEEGRRESRRMLNQVEARGRQEGALNVLSGLVKDGVLTTEEAAKRANLSQAEFLEKTTDLM